MDKDRHKKALAQGMELFEAQQEMIQALGEMIRAQIKMDKALEGMTEQERARVAADMVQGVKAENDAAIAEAESELVDDASTKH